MGIITDLRRGWNAFRNRGADELVVDYSNVGASSSHRPDRPKFRFTNERSIIASIYTRLSVDAANIPIRHIKVDNQRRYLDDINSGFNSCLTFEPNLDQGPRAFRQDIYMTLFDNGVAAIVPVDTVEDPDQNLRFDILTMRVGHIVNWYPKHVRVSVYNENKGIRQEVLVEKRYVAIIENPLYAVMNEPNSTLQRLIRKLNLLDVVDDQASSGKLDIIIQLPYVIKSEQRRQQAEQRRQDIEFQLSGSRYGIAYTDGTEKITQLNRPAENNLLKQIEFLTGQLYAQLGLTEDVMNGTADEATMINYYSRAIEPVIDAAIEGMQRAFLGIIGTQNNERVRYFRDPFKLVPVSELAEIADKFTRNEIMTANEIRGAMGLPPSKDPRADELVNSNMPRQPEAQPSTTVERTGQNGTRLQGVGNQGRPQVQ